jgi:outer membrane biosynthesis protein TonB
MKYLETEYERKSFAISATIIAILLLLFFKYGLSYMDPPPENGIAINFGNTDFGSGETNTTETVKTAPQPSESTPQPTPTAEEVITQESVDAAVIKATKKPVPTKEVKKEVQPKKVEAQKPSQKTTDALSSLLNGSKNDGKATDGDGDSNQAGNQGKIDGSIYANSFYGKGDAVGKGETGWGLKGRNLTSPGAVRPNCNDEGTVVIQVTVNKDGTVRDAKQSTLGSNITSTCLVNAAIQSALKYKWNNDEKAPNSQIGFVVFNYRNGVAE